MTTNTLNGRSGFAAIVVSVFVLACATHASDQYHRKDISVAKPTALPAFTAAIENGDVTRVVQLLDGSQEQINLPVGKQGWTPLQRAIRYGHHELVEVLVKQGANVNLADNYGWAPLHYAAMNGRETAVSFLLGNGADINQRGHQGETPLHWALNNNQKGTVVLLVRRGAHLNPLDSLGRTPLDIATKTGRSSLLKFLRDAGCFTSEELAEIYDWTAPRKTLLKLQTFQCVLNTTLAREREDSVPNKPDAGDGE